MGPFDYRSVPGTCVFSLRPLLRSRSPPVSPRRGGRDSAGSPVVGPFRLRVPSAFPTPSPTQDLGAFPCVEKTLGLKSGHSRSGPHPRGLDNLPLTRRSRRGKHS